jgi:alpha-amylase/alpha-mannosidase (GH57 family)
MPDAKIRLAFLWHMHQPYYKDLAANIYDLPWTRLHGLKDYYGMVAILEEFPKVHMTFNLVPSLLQQLQDYAAGTAREELQEIAFLPADELTVDQKLFALRFLIQANVENLIRRFPRYRELYERIKAQRFHPERALPFFQQRDLTDLQVLSQLAWSDEQSFDRDPVIRSLVEKQEGYTFEDQQLLRRTQQEFLKGIVPAYRAAAERGQVEISTSPYYHPILPLLCDTNIALQAHPGVRLPSRHFRHPEDARIQLERAITCHRELFGAAPQGLWPSEGSVSEEVLGLASSLGFRWIATDQRILTNSTGIPFYRDGSGTMVNGDRLYAPWRFDAPHRPIHILFRDQELSDLIGFVYSRMDPEAAASDLVGRILQSARPFLEQGQSVLFPIILDGENAWEYFPRNGRPFLRALYRRLSEEPRIECVTMSEGLDRHGPAQRLMRLAPGSWIGANFDIWISADEDNQAWDLLAETRRFFAERYAAAPPEQQALAQEELLIAEGSDWCWWYGPEHSAANDPDFDRLYRTHLSNVYRALGQRPPETLSQPIAKFRVEVVSVSPLNTLAPQVDGRVSSYFEWMGAGIYSPITRATTMHGQAPLLHELYYGRNATNFYLRVDFTSPPSGLSDKVALRIGLREREHSRSAVVRFAKEEALPPSQTATAGKAVLLQAEPAAADSPSIGEAWCGKILEVALNLQALGISADRAFQFQVSLWQEGLPLESLPLDGWLSVPEPAR